MIRSLWRWRRRALAIAATVVVAVAVSNLGLPTSGLASSFATITRTRFASTTEPVETAPDPLPGFNELAAPEALEAPRLPLSPAGPVRVAFLGDSVAWSTASAVTSVAATHAVEVVNLGIWGCGTVRGTPFRYFGSTYDALPNDCDHWPEQWQAAIDRERPHVAVVMVGRWELMDRVHAGQWTHIGDPVFDQYLSTEFDRAIVIAASRGARVVVATTPYYRRGDAAGGGTWPEDEPARVDLVNSLLRSAAARHGAGVIEYGALLSPEGRLAMEIGGVRVRTDGVHIAASAGPWMAPQLFSAIRIAAGI